MPISQVTAAVESAWRSSHEAPITVSLLNSNGDFIQSLYPSSGKVNVDGRRSIRRTLSLTFPDYDGSLSPTDAFTYPLGPFAGTLIGVTRGIVQGIVSEVVTLGVFQPTNVNVQSDTSGTTVTVEGEDISASLSKKWSSAYNIPSGTVIQNAIAGMLSAVNPTLNFDLASTSYTTPALNFGTDGNSSPWDDARSLAQAAGQALFMSADNYVTSQEYADLDGDPFIDLDSGFDGVLLSVKRSMQQRQAINGVVVSAEGSGILNPLYAENPVGSSGWWITDPNSPLNYLNYGKNPTTISTPIISSQGQINTVASLLLNSVAGVQVEVEIIPLPHLDVQDRVRVVDVDSGVSLVGVVDAFTIPLTADAKQDVTVRTLSLGGAD
jgi:hypothetical protein